MLNVLMCLCSSKPAQTIHIFVSFLVAQNSTFIAVFGGIVAIWDKTPLISAFRTISRSIGRRKVSVFTHFYGTVLLFSSRCET